ncbi:methyltransferase [Amycolatopsis anabasis]|uniref:methyltransferase n=1 Tax=Amycolatopsis anabasis TaxID=1840409 RepID=UPI00131DC956|nr:methyltransferase [Amycolatopsis anabasis]
MTLLSQLRDRLVPPPMRPVPAFMTDFLSAWGFRAVCIAFRNGIFDSLNVSPKTPAVLAEETGIHPGGMALLLDALNCLGYVREQHGRYENTAMTSRLRETVKLGVPYFEKIVFRDWEHLESQLRDGRGVRPVWFGGDWKIFQNGMVSLAQMNIDEVLRRVKINRSARRLLDLGGGHGLYSIAFCRRYRRLGAVVFDVPQVEKIVTTTVAEHGMQDRVKFRAGDFFTDELDPADVVLLFNIIHSKSEAENLELMRRVYETVEPGGTVVLLDQFPSPKLGKVGYTYGSLMALSMFSAAGQRTYQGDEVRNWFTKVGLTDTRFVPIRSAPGNALVIARKRG